MVKAFCPVVQDSLETARTKEESAMTAYELFWLDERGEYHLIGLLPEKRKDPSRITRESILNWGGTLLGNTLNMNNLFFIQIDL